MAKNRDLERRQIKSVASMGPATQLYIYFPHSDYI